MKTADKLVVSSVLCVCLLRYFVETVLQFSSANKISLPQDPSALQISLTACAVCKTTPRGGKPKLKAFWSQQQKSEHSIVLLRFAGKVFLSIGIVTLHELEDESHRVQWYRNFTHSELLSVLKRAQVTGIVNMEEYRQTKDGVPVTSLKDATFEEGKIHVVICIDTVVHSKVSQISQQHILHDFPNYTNIGCQSNSLKMEVLAERIA